MANKNIMMALLIAPEKEPKQVCFENTLENLQGFVGGWIESVCPFNDEVAIICNEEGKLDGLPLNRTISTDCFHDIIAGNFLVVGCDGEKFCSLTEDQIERYKEMFKEPEIFKYPINLDDLEL